MSTPINPRLLYLFDAIRNLPVPEADLDPDLITLGLEAGVIRRILPLDDTGVVTVWLTGTGVETALAMRSEGQLLLNLDITRHGLRLTRDLTQDEWSITLSRIRVVKEAYHTALADLLNYGRAQFGPEFVEEKITQLAFPFDDINHAISIGCTHISLREKWRLTSEHCYILGLKFPTDPTSQELWAQRSSEHKLSPLALRRSIEHGSIITDTTLSTQTGKDSGVLLIQGLTLKFRQWKTQVGGVDQILNWPIERRIAFLTEIEDMVDTAIKVRDSLPA
jgi:hypothetical protein